MARSALTPDAIIRAAHHNLLGLRHDLLTNLHGALVDEQPFFVRAGPGGFICEFRIGVDRSSGYSYSVIVRARTWLANDMLHDEQILLVGDCLPGERLGDGWLLPAPLRRITRDGDRAVEAHLGASIAGAPCPADGTGVTL